MTVNFASVDPAAIVTVAGTEAAFELLASLINIPPVGALKLIVTVPAEVPAPYTVVGLRFREAKTGGLSVTVAVLMTVPFLAVIVATFWEATPKVLTVKLAELWPAAMTTLDGTGAAGELLDREIVTGFVPAFPFRLTWPVTEVPPETIEGVTFRSEN